MLGFVGRGGKLTKRRRLHSTCAWDGCLRTYITSNGSFNSCSYVWIRLWIDGYTRTTKGVYDRRIVQVRFVVQRVSASKKQTPSLFFSLDARWKSITSFVDLQVLPYMDATSAARKDIKLQTVRTERWIGRKDMVRISFSYQSLTTSFLPTYAKKNA